jgi:hypothetical protein
MHNLLLNAKGKKDFLKILDAAVFSVPPLEEN